VGFSDFSCHLALSRIHVGFFSKAMVF